MSLFSVIRAVPLDEHGNPLDEQPVEDPEAAADPAPIDAGEAIPGLVGEDDTGPTPAPFSLSAPEFEELVPTPEPSAVVAQSTRSKKRKLREQNSAVVRALVHKTRLGHAQVNAELNKRVGLKRVTEATAAQLEKRLEAGRKWLERS